MKCHRNNYEQNNCNPIVVQNSPPGAPHHPFMTVGNADGLLISAQKRRCLVISAILERMSTDAGLLVSMLCALPSLKTFASQAAPGHPPFSNMACPGFTSALGRNTLPTTCLPQAPPGSINCWPLLPIFGPPDFNRSFHLQR